jgi:hypothetical protein
MEEVKRMSKQAVEDVLRKASSDSGFRNRLTTDFDATVKGYDLSDSEKQQLQATSGFATAAGPGQHRQAANQATNQAANQAQNQAANQAQNQAANQAQNQAANQAQSEDTLV